MKQLLFLLIGFFLFCGLATAQPFEIRAVNKGFGVIGVELRKVTASPPTIQNYVTDLVFGLKWNTSAAVDLSNAVTTGYNIKKSGTRKTKNEFYYQAFFADQTPFLIPADWAINQWVEIMRIANSANGSGTATFFICEKSFDATTDPNFGLDLTDYEPVIREAAVDVSLPVNLILFTATAEKNAIKAAWKTSGEVNNKGFFLQRSLNDAGGFVNLAWLDAKGSTATNDYDFIDQNVQPNTDYYYRLQQVDKNGRLQYSPVRKARLEARTSFGLTPNPVKDFLTFFLPPQFSADKTCTIRITDAKGSVVYQKAQAAQTSPVLVPVKNLPAGSYFFSCEENNKVLFTQSFIKL